MTIAMTNFTSDDRDYKRRTTTIVDAKIIMLSYATENVSFDLQMIGIKHDIIPFVVILNIHIVA